MRFPLRVSRQQPVGGPHAILSHEFATPVTAIQSAPHLLVKPPRWSATKTRCGYAMASSHAPCTTAPARGDVKEAGCSVADPSADGGGISVEDRRAIEQIIASVRTAAGDAEL